MNNITIDEVKDILKCSIDETTNMNEAIERTLQHIYSKGWNDAEKEHNYHLDKMRTEIDRLDVVETIYDGVYAVDASDVVRIIDKYTGGKQIYDKSRKDVLKQIIDEIRQIVDEETKHDEKWARGLQYSLCIIDKYRNGENE